MINKNEIMDIRRQLMIRYIINGTVCLEHELKKCDIEITDGIITAIGEKLPKIPEGELIDASGLYVIPGIVDFHTHIQEKGLHFNQSETYRSGSKLAILNGITTINAFIVQNFNQSLAQAITSTAELAENNCYCDYRWHLTPTRFSDINYTDIGRWVDKGFGTYKFYTTYKQQNLYLTYERISEIIRRLKKYEPQFIIHAEDETIMNQVHISNDFRNFMNFARIHNEESELTAVEKIIKICKSTQTQIHMAHVSSSDAFGQIELAKRDCAITCETTPHYVFFNDQKLLEGDRANYFITPPLRNEECRHLMEVKTSMGYPEVICSNHKAFSDSDYQNKDDYRNVPSGMPGMGALFPMFYDLLVGKYKWELPKLMSRLAINPAMLAKIYPKKGVIAVGSDADIVLFNPNGTQKQIMSSFEQSFNIWHEFQTKVEIKEVLLRGQSVVKNGQLLNEDQCKGKPLCIVSA
jgi:dihydropyrimidinase